MAAVKKHWVPIIAPKLFNEGQLGESYVLETDTLAGRAIKSNLMTVSGDMKKQNLNVSFRITHVKDGKAYTRPTGITMQTSSVKRLVRRGRSKIDVSIIVNLKHGQKARIKPIAVTKFVVNNSIATALRSRLAETLTQLTTDLSFETLIADIASLKLQRHLRHSLGTICPIRSVDIRACALLPAHAMDEEHEAEESGYAAADQASDDDSGDRG